MRFECACGGARPWPTSKFDTLRISLIILYGKECSTENYTIRKIHTKLRPGPEVAYFPYPQ